MNLPHDIHAILTGVPVRDIVESYLDQRISKLLVKVNMRNRGDGRDLEALFRLARRDRKRLYNRHSYGTDNEITNVTSTDDLPTGMEWLDIMDVYVNVGGNPPAGEPLFVLNDENDPKNWWTYHELVTASSHRGFYIN